jgi:uncharacterized coiled-coil protein SlyX
MNEKALEDLQVKVAFLEDSLSKLSDEFYLQQRELDGLKSKYAGLVNKVRGMGGSDTTPEQVLDERPPHY